MASEPNPQPIAERPAVLPPALHPDVRGCDDLPDAVEPADDGEELQPIAGYVCIIEYADVHGEVSERMIQCRRYEIYDGNPIVGAICGKSGRYKQFRCDRVLEVTDPETGQCLGDGHFFGQFAVGRIRDAVDTWNTTSQRKSLIIAGLNVLCFMARCDGRWHQLEEEQIVDFVCALWMRKEWEGEPPLDEIVAHARRLAPDGEILAKAVRQYAHSTTSSAVLKRYVQRVVAADGTICDKEHHWTMQFDEMLADAQAAEAAARRRAALMAGG